MTGKLKFLFFAASFRCDRKLGRFRFPSGGQFQSQGAASSAVLIAGDGDGDRCLAAVVR